MVDVREIAAEQFEQELTDGRPVVVVDVRSAADFDEWRVDPGRAAITNLPAEWLDSDPAAALGGVAKGAELRVICSRGNTSRRQALELAERFPGAASVRGGMIGWSRVLARDEVPMPGPSRVIQFRRQARGCLSYLITAGGEGLVVDPAPGVEAYLEEADRLGVRLVAVFDTHVHADHLSGARELASRSAAVLFAPAAALARGIVDPSSFTPVADGGSIPLGAADVRVVALPGHTSDMTGLMVDGAALIGGDSLFADSVARPDLEVGAAGAVEAAKQLRRTLDERVLSLPGSTLLLPCHYPGGRIAGPLAPTLDEARSRVPELELTPEAFAAAVTASMPPRPQNYEQIIAVNLGNALDPETAAGLEVGANNCAVSTAWAG